MIDGSTISVIIPTHNRALYVAEALDSVLAQTCQPLEIIVIDDGSSDSTVQILASYADAVTVIHQSHRGVSAARNTGIMVARGQWLAFLDSDDLWLPVKLERQVQYLNRYPNIKICQTEEIWIHNGRRRNPKRYHAKPNGYCFEQLLQRCLVSPSAVIIHRSVLEETGLFDTRLPVCEDYDLWLRIGCRYSIGLLDEPLIIKRGGHPDQLSASIPAKDKYRIQAMVKLLRTQPLTEEQQRQVLAVLQTKCQIYGNGCKKRGRFEEAEKIQNLPGEIAKELDLRL